MWAILGAAVTTLLGAHWLERREHARPGEAIAHTADGGVIGVCHGGVRLRPGRSPELEGRAVAWFPALAPRARRAQLTDDLEPGALSLARMRLGEEAEAWWVVEGLDAEGEALRVCWGFEYEHAARDVLVLLRRQIVCAPVADHGHAIVVSEADLDRVAGRIPVEET